MQIAVTLARVLLGGLLVVTGALKINHAPELASAMAGFRLGLPVEVVSVSAVALPYFEVLLGFYLLLGLFTRAAGIVAAVQFVVYGAVIGSAVVRNIPANCGCFGPGDAATADWPHVAFDLLLAAIAAFIAAGAPGILALDRRLRP